MTPEERQEEIRQIKERLKEIEEAKRKKETGARVLSGAYEGSGLAGTLRLGQAGVSKVLPVSSPYKGMPTPEKIAQQSRDVSDVLLMPVAGVKGLVGGVVGGGALSGTGAGEKIGGKIDALTRDRFLNFTKENVKRINQLGEEMKSAVAEGNQEKVEKIKKELQDRTAKVPTFLRRTIENVEGLDRAILGTVLEAGPAVAGLGASVRGGRIRPTTQKRIEGKIADPTLSENFRRATGRELPSEINIRELSKLPPAMLEKQQQIYGNAFKKMLMEQGESTNKNVIEKGTSLLTSVGAKKTAIGQTIGDMRKATIDIKIPAKEKAMLSKMIDNHLIQNKVKPTTAKKVVGSATLETPVAKRLLEFKGKIKQAKNLNDVIRIQRELSTTINRMQKQGITSEAGTHLLGVNTSLDDFINSKFAKKFPKNKTVYSDLKKDYASLKAIDNNFLNAFEKNIKARSPEKLADAVILTGSNAVDDLLAVRNMPIEGGRTIGTAWNELAVADVMAKSVKQGTFDVKAFRKRIEKIKEISGDDLNRYFEPETANLITQLDDLAGVLERSAKSAGLTEAMKEAIKQTKLPSILTNMVNGVNQFAIGQFASPGRLGLSKSNVVGIKIGDAIIKTSEETPAKESQREMIKKSGDVAEKYGKMLSERLKKME